MSAEQFYARQGGQEFVTAVMRAAKEGTGSRATSEQIQELIREYDERTERGESTSDIRGRYETLRRRLEKQEAREHLEYQIRGAMFSFDVPRLKRLLGEAGLHRYRDLL